jgi:hypothetical protein
LQLVISKDLRKKNKLNQELRIVLNDCFDVNIEVDQLVGDIFEQVLQLIFSYKYYDDYKQQEQFLKTNRKSNKGMIEHKEVPALAAAVCP